MPSGMLITIPTPSGMIDMRKIIDNIHPNDFGMFLDQYHVAIRTGHHCAQPLMEYLDITSSARVSFGVYNNLNDIEILINSLSEAKKFLIQK